MRVALLTSLARGGPLEQAIVLATELVRRKVAVDAICADAPAAERFAAAGARPAVIPLRRAADVRGALAIRRRISRADVLHAHDRRSALWMRLLPRPTRRAVLVDTIHGLPGPYLDPRGWHERPRWRARIQYEGIDAGLCRRCDVIIVPSHAAAGVLHDRLGYPSDRMTIVPNGVAVTEPHPPTGEALIGTLALMDPIKGLDVFLRAAAQLSRSRPDARFVLFGEGAEALRLAELASDLDLDDRLTMPGHSARPEALARLGILVLSSWIESSPMALLEAMAAGVPVVATRVGGIPEIAVEGTAQLVPPGDPVALAAAVGRLLDDPDLRERQIAAAHTRVSTHYTAARNATTIEALYRRAVEIRG